MFRYIAFVWNSSDPSRFESVRCLVDRLIAIGWKITISHPGLYVLSTGDRKEGSQSHVLANQSGVILGTIFEKNNFDSSDVFRKTRFDAEDTRHIIESGGRYLIEHFWGRYVAFLIDVSSEHRWILRDPTGFLPCFYTTLNGVMIFFSCFSDCVRLGDLRFTINWDFIRPRLVFGSGPANQTALNEVSEVYGGEAIEIQGEDISRTFYWNPIRLASSEAIEDQKYASEVLRSTVKSCVHAWASCHSSVLHYLSGGLDSSVVMSFLANAPSKPRITSVTYYVPNGNADERPYSRLAARHCNVGYVEYARDPSAVRFDELFRAKPLVNPISGGYAPLELSHVERRLVIEHGATAISTGEGGDALFGSFAAPRAATDYAQLHGVKPELFRVAANLAVEINTSIWTVLARAIRDGLIKRQNALPGYDRSAIFQLLSREMLGVYANATHYPHPWYFDIEGAPAGPTRLMVALTQPRDFYDPLIFPEEQTHEPLHPLLSQPLIELCLRIPSYVHAEGGRNRGLARRSFVHDVPAEILKRQWKDRAVGQTEATLLANIRLLRETLLGGLLVSHKLLDSRRLEVALSTMGTKDAVPCMLLIDYLIVEAWLRSQPGASLKIAA